jgi:glutamate carboxypeptidase
LGEARRVAERAAAELDAIVGDVERWCAVLATTGDVAALTGLANMVAHRLEGLGLDVELVDVPGAAPYFHAVVEGAGTARIAFLCHHDTVAPTSPDWGPRIREDRICGLGVSDMRGGLAVAVHAARLLAEGPRPFARLELVSASDEEGRGRPPATLERLRGFDAVLCFECGSQDGSVISARKGARWVRLEATGREAHAGVDPDEGRNAVVALVREVARLEMLRRGPDGQTVEVTTFTGGHAVNTVPGRAELVADVRALTNDALEQLVSEVCAVDGRDEVELAGVDLGGFPPMPRTESTAALARTAAELGRSLGADVGEATTGGSSDACWAATLGLPVLDGLGPVGGLDHTPAEYAEIASFPVRCGIAAGLVGAVDGGLVS